MPRNSSGTYSLPQAAFVAGTTIVAATMNSNLSDIATALTGSVAANGVTPMTGPLLVFAGAVATPGLTFVGNTNTGFYSLGGGAMALALNGTLGVTFAANGNVTFVGAIATKGITDTNGISTTGNLATGAALGVTTYTNIVNSSDPTTPAANNLRIYVKDDANSQSKLFAKEEAGNVYPLIGIYGQCRLTVSGGNLLLSPQDGNLITINTIPYQIPDAGVTLARAGVTDNTFFYVYLYNNSGTLTLELSATGYSAQAGTGVMIKTGDATRTLVGAVYSDVTSFKDTNGTLYTLSYYNRRLKYSQTNFTTARTSSSVGMVELNTEIRNNFIRWADENVFIVMSGAMGNVTATNQSTLGLLVDGAVAANTKANCTLQGQNANGIVTLSTTWKDNTLTENAVHFATMGVASAAGSLITVYQVVSNGILSNIQVQING